VLAQDLQNPENYSYQVVVPPVKMLLINDDTLKGEDFRKLVKFDLGEEYKEWEIQIEYDTMQNVPG
jgi:hypothetical protein